jgi:hypothetical protein
MRKLIEVEDARRLMTEAMDWSVFKWLWEKRRVRETADRANAALDELEKRVKARWHDQLKAAYKEFQGPTGIAKARRQHSGLESEQAIQFESTLLFDKVKRADDKAYRARMDAERTFDEAERLLNTDLAREGCQKAIRSWDLKEKAIRQAEAGTAANKATT